MIRRTRIVQNSANNLPGVKTLLAHYLNVIDLLNFDKVVISHAAVDVIESWLGQARRSPTTARSTRAKRRRGRMNAHQIIVRPLITEKNTNLMALNKYCFEVDRDGE